MKRQSLTNSTAFIFCIIILLVSVTSTIHAQGRLKYDSAKARKEAEFLSNQTKGDSLSKAYHRQEPDYTIQRNGDYFIISFNDAANVTGKDFFQNFSKQLNLTADDRFLTDSMRAAKAAPALQRYRQHYKGVPVMGGQITLHEKNGKLDFANGKFFTNLSVDVTPSISKEAAVQAAIKSAAAKQYRWQNEAAEADLKERTGNADTSYYPKPRLVIAPVNGIYKKENMRLCYQVYIASDSPYQQTDVYVDAHSGEIISSINQLQDADVSGSNNARTLYYGVQSITTNSYNGTYQLQESGSRPIQTYDMLNQTIPGKSIVFTNLSNNWNHSLNKLRTMVITRLNDNWKDPIEDNRFFGGADVYVKVTDVNGSLLLKTDVVSNVSAFPLIINLNALPLLAGSRYTLTVWDRDFLTSDDLLGTIVFSPSSAAPGVYAFTDGGTEGRYIVGSENSGALDAHWGMERVYDYYTRFGQRSYDGYNSTIKSYLHINKLFSPGSLPDNAFWNQDYKSMFFGDGDGIRFSSFAALDIAGHEFTHGVIQNSGSNLTNNTLAESGALNESFADIFGTATEFSALGGNANWTIGEKIFIHGGFIRSLKNPRLEGDPDTYHGDNWYYGSNASVNVHNNTGVQNKWFYLLSEGGSGFIDRKPARGSYQVTGIGINNAATIAYHNMIEWLQPSSDYSDAYFGSLSAAEYNGYPIPSDGYRAVREAWYAVGVANKPVINSFTPQTGDYGTSVTINGTDFTGISYIGFNGVYIPFQHSYLGNSSNYTTINVDVPYGTTTGLISLIAGADTIYSTDTFYVCKPLTVSVSSTDANTFVVNVADGKRPYLYSVDNLPFQTDSAFQGLTTGQTHIAHVKDAVGCTGQSTFYVSDSLLCDVQAGSGGQGTTFVNQVLGTSAGSVSVDYQMYTIPDQMDIYYNNQLVASTGGLVSGAGTLQFNYQPLPGGPYSCVIRMYAPLDGTVWDFIAYCPVSFAKNGADKTVLDGKKTIELQPSMLKAILYPNPAADIASLKLEGTNKTSVSVVLTDAAGKRLWQTNGVRDGIISLPVKDLPAGIYMVNIVSNGEKKVLKLLRK